MQCLSVTSRTNIRDTVSLGVRHVAYCLGKTDVFFLLFFTPCSQKADEFFKVKRTIDCYEIDSVTLLLRYSKIVLRINVTKHKAVTR